MWRRRRRPFSGAGDAPRKGKKIGKHKELTTNPFPRSVQVEDDRRGGSTVEQASSTSNGDRWGLGDSGRGEAGLGVWESGGGAEEGSRTRNRGLVAGGGRSMEKGRRRRERSAPLGSGRSEEEERNDEWVPHPSRQISRRCLADCPRAPSRMSARQVLHSPRISGQLSERPIALRIIVYICMCNGRRNSDIETLGTA